MNDRLKTELQTYEKLLPDMLSDEGMYAVIKGEELIGKYETYNDALKAGYDRFGVQPFLVKKISSVENIAFFSRAVRIPCHT